VLPSSLRTGEKRHQNVNKNPDSDPSESLIKFSGGERICKEISQSSHPNVIIDFIDNVKQGNHEFVEIPTFKHDSRKQIFEKSKVIRRIVGSIQGDVNNLSGQSSNLRTINAQKALRENISGLEKFCTKRWFILQKSFKPFKNIPKNDKIRGV
jgi:hypothetical protein